MHENKAFFLFFFGGQVQLGPCDQACKHPREKKKIYIYIDRIDDVVFAINFCIGSEAVFAADFCISGDAVFALDFLIDSDAVFVADFCIGSDAVLVFFKKNN